jgi:anaerobic selenocysteine-containing dehydrogenase
LQWPCTDQAPDGTPRLYTDNVFNTAAARCEAFGHDLVTGGAVTGQEYRADDPDGKAILKAVRYRPPTEEPSDQFPLRFTTGRTVYHFHTRTKTARARRLQAAAPEPWIEISPKDADRFGVSDGDMVRLESRRGAMEARARVIGVAEGVVFAPFHYGSFGAPNGASGAANELTPTEWDPVSKQPHFKVAAVRVRRVDDTERGS